MRNDLSAVKEMLVAKVQEAEVVNDPEVDDNELEEVKDLIEGESLNEVVDEEVNEEEEGEEEQEEESQEQVATDDSYTMKSLAEAIEIDQQELYGVMVPMRDGAEPISIGEMKNQFMDLVKDKPVMEAKIQELEQSVTQGTPQQQMSQLETQAQFEMMKVQDEFNNTDWADLDEFDPGKSALLRQQFNDRYNQAQNVMGQAGQQRQAEHQTFLTEQNTKLLEIIPTWTDSTVRTADQTKIEKIMLDAGYNQEIIAGNTDPISLKLLHELMTLRDEKAKGAELVKKVKKAPRALGSQRIAPERKGDKLQKLVNKAKSTRNKHDAFAAVKGILGGS